MYKLKDTLRSVDLSLCKITARQAFSTLAGQHSLLVHRLRCLMSLRESILGEFLALVYT